MIRQVQKLGRLGGRVGEWCGRWWLCWRSRCRGVHLACYVGWIGTRDAYVASFKGGVRFRSVQSPTEAEALKLWNDEQGLAPAATSTIGFIWVKA